MAAYYDVYELGAWGWLHRGGPFGGRTGLTDAAYTAEGTEQASARIQRGEQEPSRYDEAPGYLRTAPWDGRPAYGPLGPVMVVRTIWADGRQVGAGVDVTEQARREGALARVGFDACVARERARRAQEEV